MTLRIVPTPLGPVPQDVAPRRGGMPAALLEALVPAAGLEPVRDKLRRPDVLVVTTGQQPALFTGPMYTLYKALSAAALAARLEAAWARPVVPVFWSAGDDHDFAEANHAAWLTLDGSLRTGSLRARPADAPLTPLYREPLGPDVAALLAQLREDLPVSEHRERTLAWLAAHFRPDASIADASHGALAELLAPAGVACLDSTHPALKRLAAPHLLAAAHRAGELDAALARRAEALRAAGEAPGVPVGDGATLLMLEASQGRDRLVADGAGFVTRRSGERLSRAELERIAEREPERLSANVLLRPVVESALLPTVAYVAGPGELRYLRLTPPLYQLLEVPRQRPVPRWSGVLVEPRVDRVLEKFGLDLAALLDPSGEPERRLVRSRVPESALETLTELRAALETGYGRLEALTAQLDPTLVRSIAGVRHRALAGARDAEKRLERAVRRRAGVELAQLARARGAVLPGGEPQERVLTPASFLGRHGTGLVAALRDAIADWYAGALEGAPVPS